ncbi:MAG: thiopurine S-methyltransferase [Cyanobacteria bacterium J06621_15]
MEFWLESWEAGGTKTSFHRPDVHPYIKNYIPDYFLRGQRVLIPLCGKDNALMWYRERAAHVVGIELSSIAIEQFFEEHNLAYEKTIDGRYEADNITIFNRDIFDLKSADIGKIDLVYDRAALVALPEDLRQRYRQKIDEFMYVGSKCLLITLEFQPYLGAKPPFSITPQEVQSYYGDKYIIDHIKEEEQPQHRMVEKFNLNYLKEHAFFLTKITDSNQKNIQENSQLLQLAR